LKVKSAEEKRRFILDNTSISSPPHVPEIRLHLAGEAHDLWLKTEEELEAIGLPPPFWAFAWAGGQGLARYILDHPETVRGRRVLDLATGSGLVAIAAAMAGASTITANDIDPFSNAAVDLNAAINKVAISFDATNRLLPELDHDHFDTVLAGDVFYDRAMAVPFEILLKERARQGLTVIVGDPERAYFPQSGMKLLSKYQIEVSRALEDNDVKRTKVWRVV